MYRIILRASYFVSVAAICQLIVGGTSVSGQQPRVAPVQIQPAPQEIQPAEDAQPLEAIPMEALMANMYARRPDLFYNYYAAPGMSGNAATMYPAPRPIPQSVGNVYYTYQPMMPHEWMYPHYREYYTPYGNLHGYGACQGHGSVNRTTIRWQRGYDTRSSYLYRFHQRPGVPMIPCGNGGGLLGFGLFGGSCGCTSGG